MLVGNPGYIYCFSHEYYTTISDNLYKLGCSYDIDQRSKSVVTFMISKMVCEHREKVKHKYDAENLLFERLQRFRLKKNRELYVCDLKHIIKIMKAVAKLINSRAYSTFRKIKSNNNKNNKQKTRIKCFRCGELFCPSLFKRHISRKRNICEPTLSLCTYREMQEDYDKCLITYKKELKVHACEYCGNEYANRHNKHRHKKKCSVRLYQLELEELANTVNEITEN